MRLRLSVVLVLAGMLSGAVKVYAFEALNIYGRDYEIGFGLGMQTGGKIVTDVFDENLNASGSLLLKGFVDAYVVPKLAVGAYINYTSLPSKHSYDTWGTPVWDGYTWDFPIVTVSESYSINIIEIGGSIKPRFFINERTAIKPGISIGYRQLSIDGSGFDSDNLQALGINPSCEIQYALNDRTVIFGELGAFTQPAGGNKNIGITFGPILYILAGITF